MAEPGDVGAGIIDRIAGRLPCDPHRITFWRHGLTWYPGGLTQHIWTEEAPRQSGLNAWRVHIRTWCLKRVVASSSEMVAAIAAELPLNSVGALVRKPGSPSRLGLATSMWLTADRVDWTSRLLGALASLQADDALRLGRARPVLESGAAADVSADHLGIDAPELTAVQNPGDLTAAAIAPLEAISFVEIADALRAHDGVRAIAMHSGVTASFPWAFEGDRNDFILLEMRVAARQPIGPGVWTTVSLPLGAPTHLLHALALNETEIAAQSPTDLVGGWLVRNQTLMHESFVPWTLCSGPVVQHLAESAVRRANWLRHTGPSILPGEWPDEVRGRVLAFRGPLAASRGLALPTCRILVSSCVASSSVPC